MILDQDDMLVELQVRLPRAWCGGRGHLGKDRLAGRRAHTEDPCLQGIHKYFSAFFARANEHMEYIGERKFKIFLASRPPDIKHL